ncbi:SpoIIE family protein phosphatase [Streptomyces verrucosisporus]|uniref:SpoIIE family protein phosphatase n=1 Tax=Streptomyces verrucosisporus TaxID=1695161 RepID=UPI0019D1C3FC|nr:SpoIIE family protein phosphatase [Streptomyces verrucosisporus]MBN3929151.1 SpoIIE family protein phosphatase [Streptomyces verrucosisporus]
MPGEKNRILLVDVLPETAEDFEAAFGEGTASGEEVELVHVTAASVLEHTEGRPGERRPAVAVVGRRVPAPVGLIHALRPHPADLAAVVVATSATDSRLTTLPILFSADLVRRIPDAQVHLLPRTARELLGGVTGRRAEISVRATVQRQLTTGTVMGRQLGERLLGEFLTQAPIGALMLDDDGTVLAWNHRASDVLELDDHGSLRRPLADLFPPDARAALRQHLATAREQSAPGPDVVFERTGSDGTSQAIRIAPQKVTDSEGRERVLVLAEDVTDRLHAQRKLAERTGHALLSAEVAAAMTASGPLAERLHRCVRATADRLGADRACLWTLTPSGRPEPAACADMERTTAAERLHPEHADEELVGRIVDRKRPHLDLTPPGGRHTGSGRPAGSFAGYPLVSGGELIGVLTLSTRLALPGSTLSILENIADQVAVGIQRDRLLHRLRATTQALERPLLPPRLPELPGFDLAARYHPFGSGLHIGGDFYDAFAAPDGRYVLALGDVCGKGPGAAAITGLVRHTLWAAAQHTTDPEHVLGLVNNALRRQNTPFCTLAYAVLEPPPDPSDPSCAVRVRIASAGHPAPLLRRADGRAVPLEVRGPLLGVLDELHHPVTEAELRPGETLVFYTDGFTEGAGAEDRREPEDLAALLAGHPSPSADGRPADRVVAALLEDAHSWWGERLRDDLAVLALSRLG